MYLVSSYYCVFVLAVATTKYWQLSFSKMNSIESTEFIELVENYF